MEYSKEEPLTPRFGYSKDSETLFEESLSKRFRKSSLDSPKNEKTEEKYTNKKNEKVKSKIKSKEKSKNKSKEKTKSKNKEKTKSKSKEDSKNKYKSSKQKKSISGTSLPSEKKYQNSFDILLNKKLMIRNDFDQNNSEKFLSEKELAFQQFKMSKDADLLDD